MGKDENTFSSFDTSPDKSITLLVIKWPFLVFFSQEGSLALFFLSDFAHCLHLIRRWRLSVGMVKDLQRKYRWKIGVGMRVNKIVIYYGFLVPSAQWSQNCILMNKIRPFLLSDCPLSKACIGLWNLFCFRSKKTCSLQCLSG